MNLPEKHWKEQWQFLKPMEGKTACVVRYGAFGDVIMLTGLLSHLKQLGYHVTMNMTPRAQSVLRHNPNIDEYLIQEDDEIPNEELGEYWENLAKGYDKFINLSGSVEGGLLKIEGKPSFNWDKEVRHEKCNRNYYDEQFKVAGYPEITGKNGELFFTNLEESLAKSYRRKLRGKFVVMWSLAGSSFHKNYPYTQIVCDWLLKDYDDIVFVLVGDTISVMLEWEHPRVKCRSDKWSIRQAMLMTKYVDLVVGAETGILNAAGCYDTHKIVLLSHSTEENLSKYWKNCTSLHAPEDVVPCYPCHQLHYSLESCPLHEKLRTPLCMTELKFKTVHDEIERHYEEWKNE